MGLKNMDSPIIAVRSRCSVAVNTVYGIGGWAFIPLVTSECSELALFFCSSGVHTSSAAIAFESSSSPLEALGWALLAADCPNYWYLSRWISATCSVLELNDRREHSRHACFHRICCDETMWAKEGKLGLLQKPRTATRRAPIDGETGDNLNAQIPGSSNNKGPRIHQAGESGVRNCLVFNAHLTWFGSLANSYYRSCVDRATTWSSKVLLSPAAFLVTFSSRCSTVWPGSVMAMP